MSLGEEGASGWASSYAPYDFMTFNDGCPQLHEHDSYIFYARNASKLRRQGRR